MVGILVPAFVFFGVRWWGCHADEGSRRAPEWCWQQDGWAKTVSGMGNGRLVVQSVFASSVFPAGGTPGWVARMDANEIRFEDAIPVSG
jgi:hypothetical protein